MTGVDVCFLRLHIFIAAEQKYVGVQSWKAMHLPTLDIRVKQKGNHSMKWEINFEANHVILMQLQ